MPGPACPPAAQRYLGLEERVGVVVNSDQDSCGLQWIPPINSATLATHEPRPTAPVLHHHSSPPQATSAGQRLVILEQHSTSSKPDCIAHDNKGFVKVWWLQHRCTRKSELQPVKCCLAVRAPCKRHIFARQVGQWSRDLSIPLDEPTEVVGEPQERPHICHCLRYWPAFDSCHLSWVWFDAISSNHVTQEKRLRLEKGTLFQLGIEVVLTQDLQDLLEMGKVLFLRAAVDQDVIQIHYNALVHKGCKHCIHDTVKRGRGIVQPKAQHLELVMSQRSSPR